jgi:hypothetical protein
MASAEKLHERLVTTRAAKTTPADGTPFGGRLTRAWDTTSQASIV